MWDGEESLLESAALGRSGRLARVTVVLPGRYAGSERRSSNGYGDDVERLARDIARLALLIPPTCELRVVQGEGGERRGIGAVGPALAGKKCGWPAS